MSDIFIARQHSSARYRYSSWVRLYVCMYVCMSVCVTFWRLAVIDFELGLDVIVYLFTVMCDFACWSILNVVDSRMSVTFRSHV